MKRILQVAFILAISTVLAFDSDAERVKQHLEEQEKARNKPLNYLTYDQIVETFYDLEKEYPHYIKVYNAVEQFNNSTLPETRCYKEGDPKRICKYIYAVMTNYSDPRHTNFTQSFFSGNFHGDEVVGPNILTYMAKYILEKPVLKLLSKSYIVILPMGNPSGYFHSRREEQQEAIRNGYHLSFDMNRDFPYDTSSTDCFQTAGGRIINYIWQKHLFTASITFHGGMTAIGWPWGSTNHALGRRGELSPDQNAFYAIGKRMSEIADSQGISFPAYPYNTLTNSIYAVGGSFEDWSYAASWEAQYNPTALPKCYGISEDEMYMNENIARSLTYLIETTDQKMPDQDTYGKWIEIHNPSKGISHVSRNIRLTLDFINNLSPSHDIKALLYKNYTLVVKWELEGCQTVQQTKLFYREKNPQVSNSTHSNYNSAQELIDDGFVLYKEFTQYSGKLGNQQPEKSLQIEFENPNERTIDIALISQCDNQWIEKIKDAKPVSDPQTHFVRSRLQENYTAFNNGFFINSKKYIIDVKGPYLLQNITITEPITNDYTESKVNDYLYILFGILIFGSIGSYLIYKKFSKLGQNRINFEELHDEDNQLRNQQQQQSNRSKGHSVEMQAKNQIDEESL